MLVVNYFLMVWVPVRVSILLDITNFDNILVISCFISLLAEFKTCVIHHNQESKINYGVRSIFCVLEKAEKKWWNKLLRGDGKLPHYVKVDWDKWADEDEETGMH